VFVDGHRTYPTGGGFVNYGEWTGIKLPHISSNRVRIGLVVLNGMNRLRWFFTPYFSVRPDARIHDAPPKITLQSPTSGQSFSSGSPINVAWTASDDESVRSYELHASYNGGRSWHLVEQNIPGSATSTQFKSPAGTTILKLRLRVVAIDHRFQRTAVGDAVNVSLR
jgi:hypothetical protein